MQYKKTEKPDIPDDLPELTAQQQAFAEGILSGKSASDAYRAAYNCEGSGNKTIWVEASRLKNHPDISLWLAAARKAELGHSKITLDQHIRRLDQLRQLCIESGNLGAAVQAEQLIGKALGHYTEQYKDMAANDPALALENLEKIVGKDLAQTIAESLLRDDKGTETAH